MLSLRGYNPADAQFEFWATHRIVGRGIICAMPPAGRDTATPVLFKKPRNSFLWIMNMRNLAPPARLSRVTRKKKEERIDASDAPPILDLFPAVSAQRHCLSRSRQHVGCGQADRARIWAVADCARLSVLLVPMDLCADDAARRATDRQLGGPHVVASVATAVWSTVQMG